MIQFHIEAPDKGLEAALQDKIDNLTKPKGSLGTLEALALQVGLIQQTLSPVLRHPVNVIYASDHGIADEGVSKSPKEVTRQVIHNFLNGGAGVCYLARQHGFELKIVDGGVDFDFLCESLLPSQCRQGGAPLRVGEIGLVHRHELSGALHGLFRVRCFTQDDAHIFMTPDQMKEEIKGVVRIFDEIYSTFGLTYQIELSTMPEDHMGEEKVWQFAEETLQAAIQEMGKDFILNPGDGAFYGPKLDFHLADSLGRTWQCGTIQLDFQMPERFELEYVGEDGEKHRPVMIHRALLGSIERFIGVITEHFAGAFPTWLSPVQVKVLPITDRAAAYADQVAAQLDQAGYRVEVDHRNEKIGKKIREAQLEKIPYMLVVGDKEAESGQVAVRARSKGDLGAMDFAAFLAHLKQVVDEKQMDQAL